MNQADQTNYISKAFISCSLRTEDKQFVDFIESILKAYKILPFGTVGKFSAAPTNTAELMKKNIPLADFVVVVATPIYFQKDITTENTTFAISEMLHVESGMAYMADKPLVVFVQEGTNVGNFIPTITQYITLNGKEVDLNDKWQLIGLLLNNTYTIVRQIKEQADNKVFWNTITKGLALFGGLKILESFSEDEKPKRRTVKRKTK
ncbi:MAG: hypothetical protein QM541_02915 [Flavobacterium sp.]|nr:hypothetical protein [Flavobacterium sp.]